MSNEITVRTKVLNYVKRLGFSETEIQVEVQAEKGKRVDAVIFDENNNAIIVVEWKEDNINLPKENDKTLRFNPLVRQLQLVADRLKAPYYLISNGAAFFWFKTDNTGLPLLINEPSNREELISTSEEEQLAERLTSVFEELKRFLF
jgi:type I site-specific restriction endonuclease